MEQNKKFSLSIRIDSISPSHVHCSIFSNMVLDEYDHGQVTRAKSGDLVFSCEEFKHFIHRLNYDVISFLNEKIEKQYFLNEKWRNNIKG